MVWWFPTKVKIHAGYPNTAQCPPHFRKYFKIFGKYGKPTDNITCTYNTMNNILSILYSIDQYKYHQTILYVQFPSAGTLWMEACCLGWSTTVFGTWSEGWSIRTYVYWWPKFVMATCMHSICMQCVCDRSEHFPNSDLMVCWLLGSIATWHIKAKTPFACGKWNCRSMWCL